MTPLDKTLKRALRINGADYVVTLSPESLRLTEKGKRLGVDLNWKDLVSGESALAVALHASIGRFDAKDRTVKPAKSAAVRPSKVASVSGGKPRTLSPKRSKRR